MSEWFSMENEEETRDQQRDLDCGFWAGIGPEDGSRWSWSVLDRDGNVIEDGIVQDEEAAKLAVAEWENDNVDNIVPVPYHWILTVTVILPDASQVPHFRAGVTALVPGDTRSGVLNQLLEMETASQPEGSGVAVTFFSLEKDEL